MLHVEAKPWKESFHFGSNLKETCTYLLRYKNPDINEIFKAHSKYLARNKNYNSSIRKEYTSYESRLYCNVYHNRDIENLGTYVPVMYQLIGLVVQNTDECNPLFT